VGESGFEHVPCAGDVAGQGEGVGEPEGAEQERSLFAFDLVGEVAVDQAPGVGQRDARRSSSGPVA
jgi:hypothetical protein